MSEVSQAIATEQADGAPWAGGWVSSVIASWVAAHFTAKTVSVTVYDLTQEK